MGNISEEDLQYLTAEEREFYESVAEEDDTVDETEEVDTDAVLQDDIEAAVPDDDAAGDDDGADDGDGEGDDGEDGDADDDGEGDGGEDDAAADDGQDEGDGQQEPDQQQPADGGDQGAQQPQPLLDTELPPNWQKDHDAVQQRLTELEAEWDDGEVDRAEYDRERQELRQKEKALDRQYDRAELAKEMHQTQQRNAWANDVQSFLSENPEFAPTGDKPEDNDNPWFDALDSQVKRIATAEPSLTGRQVLDKAHERVTKSMEKAGYKRQDDASGQSGGKGASGQRRQKRNVPPTLRDVPASAPTETGDGGKFAEIDKLDGLEQEAAIAKLSEKELDDYLSR